MTDIAAAVRSFLLADAGVASLVGTRISTDVIRQGETLPAVSFSKISTDHEHTLSDLAGMAHVRLQFDCYANRRLEANQVADAIRKSGIVSTKGVTHGVDIRGCRVEQGQRNEIDYSEEATDSHRYVTSFDLMVDYLE